MNSNKLFHYSLFLNPEEFRLMCGRLVTGPMTWEEYQDLIDLKNAPPLNFEPKYNLAPGSELPVVVDIGMGRELVRAEWGLWMPWMTGKRLSTFNARQEGLASSRLFSPHLTKEHRCLVPVWGFYEWLGEKGSKQAFVICSSMETPLVMAGLWNRQARSEEHSASFTIVTRPANEQMSALHHRMPLMLDSSQREAWMQGEPADGFHDRSCGELKIYPVAPLKREDGPHQILEAAE